MNTVTADSLSLSADTATTDDAVQNTATADLEQEQETVSADDEMEAVQDIATADSGVNKIAQPRTLVQ